jgi:hypothetical protein
MVELHCPYRVMHQFYYRQHIPFDTNMSIWVDQHEDAPKTITIIKEKRVDYLLLTTTILNVNSYNLIFQFIPEEVANIP